MNREDSWFTLYSGARFYPFRDNLQASIDIHDIATALSKLCRFNGHCRLFYSVAEHSVHCSKYVSPENALAALLHDATEAYVGDLIRPIKRFMPDFEELEARIWESIAHKFGLPLDLPEEVHEADNSVLMAEARDLLYPVGELKFSYLNASPPPGLNVNDPLLPAQAQELFLTRFEELTR